MKSISNDKRDKCSACGAPWIAHDGISRTCKKLQNARSALKVIHTWASFENGVELKSEHVLKLCTKVLEETV